MQTDRKWRLLEHTADLRIEVCGEDRQKLFLNAGEALTELLGRVTDLKLETVVEVNLESSGLEELLVDWLREIFFYNNTRGWILLGADIFDLTTTDLHAKLSLGLRTDDPEVGIKGVTYHGISIEKSPSGYCARVVFDV